MKFRCQYPQSCIRTWPCSLVDVPSRAAFVTTASPLDRHPSTVFLKAKTWDSVPGLATGPGPQGLASFTLSPPCRPPRAKWHGRSGWEIQAPSSRPASAPWVACLLGLYLAQRSSNLSHQTSVCKSEPVGDCDCLLRSIPFPVLFRGSWPRPGNPHHTGSHTEQGCACCTETYKGLNGIWKASGTSESLFC